MGGLQSRSPLRRAAPDYLCKLFKLPTRDEHGAGSEPDCTVFLLEPDYPNCSLVLNWIWIGLGLTLYRLGYRYIISPFEKHIHFSLNLKKKIMHFHEVNPSTYNAFYLAPLKVTSISNSSFWPQTTIPNERTYNH